MMNISEWHKLDQVDRVRVFWKGRWSLGTIVGVLPPRPCQPPHADEQMGAAVIRTEDGLDRIFLSVDIELCRND
jgi:hypothetical protein